MLGLAHDSLYIVGQHCRFQMDANKHLFILRVSTAKLELH